MVVVGDVGDFKKARWGVVAARRLKQKWRRAWTPLRSLSTLARSQSLTRSERSRIWEYNGPLKRGGSNFYQLVLSEFWCAPWVVSGGCWCVYGASLVYTMAAELASKRMAHREAFVLQLSEARQEAGMAQALGEVSAMAARVEFAALPGAGCLSCAALSKGLLGRDEALRLKDLEVARLEAEANERRRSFDVVSARVVELERLNEDLEDRLEDKDQSVRPFLFVGEASHD